MIRQPSLFEVVPDKNHLSGTDLVPDREPLQQQGLERYLSRGKEPKALIESYSPGGRNATYYRLVYRKTSKTLKRIHIKGGNTSARLANWRKDKLQSLIDRGAELEEILELLVDFNGGGIITRLNENFWRINL